jgi:hypothetical protein
MKALLDHVNGVVLGQIPPDAPDMRIVRIEPLNQAWGYRMIQLWPRIADNTLQP